jgi:ketosteroid isomerase-like protein
MSRENVDRFIGATEAFNRLARAVENLDQEALRKWLDAMDPEIRFEPQQAALQGVYSGREGAMQWLADLAEHYEGGRIEFSEIRDHRDRVLGIGEIHVAGRSSGIEAGVPAAIVMTFKDGLIVHLRDFGGDRERALEAAGLSE